MSINADHGRKLKRLHRALAPTPRRRTKRRQNGVYKAVYAVPGERPATDLAQDSRATPAMVIVAAARSSATTSRQPASPHDPRAGHKVAQRIGAVVVDLERRILAPLGGLGIPDVA